MKIEKGKISKKNLNQEELEFRKKLKKALKIWFGLKLKDIPEIIKKIGVNSEEYEITYINDDYSHLNFKVKTKNDEFEVELFRGDMVNPYSQCKVLKDDKEEIYSLSRMVQVDLLKSIDKEEKHE